MSRYISIDTVSFNDKDENLFPIKDVRPIPSEPVGKTIPIIAGTMMDEIASRDDVYGEFGEGESFRIFDLNVIELTENKFIISELKALKVPL